MSHYKPYPKYKPSALDWLDQVPDHWKRRKVAWDIEMTIGWTPPTGQSKYYGGPYNWITIADLSAGSVSNTKTKITDEAVNEAGAVPAAPGSLLFSYKLSVGEVALLTEAAYTNEAIAAFEPSPTVDMRWWKYAAPIILPKAGRENMYGALLLNQELMNGCRFDAPDLDEQIEIAEGLSKETGRIDALISCKTRFIELLQEKHHALITRAVTKGLDPNVRGKDSGVEWMGHVPEHWAVSRLGHFGTVENGTTPSRANEAYWTDGDIPWLGSGEVNQVFVTEATEYITKLALEDCSLRLLPEGTVIIGMVGQGKTRGLAAILGIEAAINQNLAAICVGPKLLGKFLLHTFAASYEWLREAGRGSNQAALNCELLGEFRLAVPPVDEQQKILAYIAERSAHIDAIAMKTRRSIALLQERRSALVTAAVTGQIDVRQGAE